MTRKQFRFVIAIVIAALLAGCAASRQRMFEEARTKTHTAVTPAVQTADWAVQWWMPRFEANNARLAEGNVDLLWIGDSITHRWEEDGLECWNEYYAHRNAVNLGFRGDRTEHVLWRLDRYDFSRVSPKLAIIMIGTNNSDGDAYSAPQIADGIIEICDRLHTKLPDMKILLLAIFPRGPRPSPQREKNAAASMLASQIADGKTIYYMDINDAFLDADGALSRDIMSDRVHPTLDGYRIWAQAVEPMVVKLMGE